MTQMNDFFVDFMHSKSFKSLIALMIFFSLNSFARPRNNTDISFFFLQKINSQVVFANENEKNFTI